MYGFDNEQSLLTRVAWMYYVQGMTHEEIANHLKFSRSKVTRMLSRARQEGIVEINVRGAYRSCIETEVKIKEREHLKDVIVVPEGENLSGTQLSVGRAAADYLNSTLQDNDVLGLAWGMSFKWMIPYLKPCKNKNITTIQLMGGITSADIENPQQIVTSITKELGAHSVLKSVPVVVDNKTIREALMSDSKVQELFKRVNDCTKALIGVSDVSDHASLCRSGAIDVDEMKEIREAGAVGNVIAWFIDIHGNVMDIPIHDRVMSPSPEVLKAIPQKILMTSGRHKCDALLGALRGGFVDVLIIDEGLAQELLKCYTYPGIP